MNGKKSRKLRKIAKKAISDSKSESAYKDLKKLYKQGAIK